MVTDNSIAVEVVLQIALTPCIECALPDRIRGLGEVARGGCVRGAASRRGRGVGRLCGTDKFIASSARLVSSLLGSSVSVSLQVILQIFNREVIKSPGIPASGCLVVVLSDQSTELIGLGGVRDRDTTGVKVALESSV